MNLKNIKNHFIESIKWNQRLSKVLAVTTFILLAFASQMNAQIYIRVVPSPPIYVRPAPPRPTHIWVDGDWVYNGRVYVWREGYWAEPRPQMIWVPGRWKQNHKGNKWEQGHWRRR
jgi:hypothetical protein